MRFLYDVCNVKLQLYAKGLVWSRGGKHFSKTFSIFYMLNSKNRVFQPIFFNCYLSNEKTASVDNSRVKATIFFIEKISFSMKLFSGHFYGQSFIKTVRGPYIHNVLFLITVCYCSCQPFPYIYNSTICIRIIFTRFETRKYILFKW